MQDKSETTWQDKQASHPNPAKEALKSWHADPTPDEVLKMENAVNAYLLAEKKCIGCDEPGCAQPASIGYPVPNGYRRTCSKHVDKEAP